MESFYMNLSPFFAWLLKTTLQGSFVVFLILLVKLILGNRLPAKWHYVFWLVLLVRLSLPWAPPSRLSAYSVFQPSRWTGPARASTPRAKAESSTPAEPAGCDGATSPSASSGGPGEGTTSKRTVASEPSAASPVEGRKARLRCRDAVASLSVLWGLGAVILAGYVLARNLLLWWAIKRERPVTDQSLLELLEDAKMQMGVQTIVGVVISDRIKSPALFGFVRPRLLLPQGTLEVLSLDELHHVFLHELAHLKRRDIFIGWWAALLQILHWFNPLIWFALRRMRTDQEVACDALVMARMAPGDPPEYGRTMVRLLERFSQRQYVPSVAGILEDTSQIERRVIMIGQYKRHSRPAAIVTGATFALLAAATLTDARSARADVLDEKVPSGLQRNLLVYYSFDRDGGTRAVDTSGMDFHGMIRGAEYTEEGCLGGAMRFDGEADFIQVTPEVSLKALTVAAWVRAQTSALNNGRIFMLDQGREYFAFEGNTRGGTTFGIAGGSHDGAVGVNDYGWSLQSGRWTHVAVTFTGSEVRLYRDGVRTKTGSVSEGRLTGRAYVGGINTHNGRYWSGDIDELAVFNRVLTDGELKHLYAMASQQPEPRPETRPGVPPAGDTTEPVAMWRFDGDARDSVGNCHGKVDGATPTAGVSGQAFAFDGQDDCIMIPNVSLSSFTFGAWVRTATDGLNNRRLFLLDTGGDHCALQGTSRGDVELSGSGFGEDERAPMENREFETGTWIHVTATFDGDRFAVYKDGQLLRFGRNPRGGFIGTLYIGGTDKQRGRFWQGAIDEVLLFDRALSEAEVGRLFGRYKVKDEVPVTVGASLGGDGRAGRWQGLASDKPEDGNSRDDVTLDLQIGGDGRVTGTVTGDFVEHPACPIEEGHVNGDRIEFHVRHRTGVRMRVWLELRDGVLQGEGLPVDADEDRCDITLKRAGRYR